MSKNKKKYECNECANGKCTLKTKLDLPETGLFDRCKNVFPKWNKVEE